MKKEELLNLIKKSIKKYPLSINGSNYVNGEDNSLFLDENGKLIPYTNINTVYLNPKSKILFRYGYFFGVGLSIEIKKLRSNSSEYIITCDVIDFDYKLDEREFEDLEIFIQKEHSKRTELKELDTKQKKLDLFEKWIKDVNAESE